MKQLLLLFAASILIYSCNTVGYMEGPTVNRMPDGTYQGNIIFQDNSIFCKIVIVGNTFEEFRSDLAIPQKESACLSKGTYVINTESVVFTQTNSTTDPVCEEILILNGEYQGQFTEFTLTFWRDVQGGRVEYILAKVEEQ